MEPDKQDIPAGIVGQWDITVLNDGRIKLPADVLRMLRSTGLPGVRLCPGRIPLVKALVLCPEPWWDRWKETLLSRYPSLKTHRGASAYLNPFKNIQCDTHGRMSLPSPACYYAGITEGLPLILVGRVYRMELWPEEEFMKAFKDCEAALAEADRQQPNSNDREDDYRARTPGGDA